MAEQSAQQRAKQPRTGLAGPYGHPFHPILVTVPIGAWIAAVIFDVAAMFTAEPEAFARGAVWLTGIGIAGALVAAVFGFLDYSQLAPETRARRTATLHMMLNLIVTMFFIVAFMLRLAGGYEDWSITGFLLSLVGLGMLGVSGWLGGKLAYRYGVRVADERTQGEAFR
ncbi:hypothetical protein D477_007039 [Arthrobacter crystallopoietes BAB-32]|uniref:DUF2231 domain-containing protein n=1 Tax=Arthrobacter crystallopoietes BAB-32 TaxID=1246476 RepID=N1V4E4_9MICC|nr:DUF2231 domain-containing protein [Arthrobacter crystallopoietes]EMY34942.1 hypothetical protein D477_007039 [Arthrobacter crystallopoietes BAB-32]